MKNTSLFDVLVVYSDGIATSASSKEAGSQLPFSQDSNRANYNDAYAYFLEMCSENNLKAAFSTSSDITGAGSCSSYWLLEKNKWLKVNKQCYSSLIFDKFSPINDLQKLRRDTLFSNSVIQPFNAEPLFSIFFDKQKTYTHLKDFAIPTVAINKLDRISIKRAIAILRKLIHSHVQKQDFSRNLVLKDRYGAGGNGIYLISSHNAEKEIRNLMKNNRKISFILQPFVNFDKGVYEEYSGFIDFRIIYLGRKIIQAFVRTAKKNDFRCNVHQGGMISYISPDEIPLKVKRMSEKIITFLNEDKALFSLDYIVSNQGNVYLLEGNCGPGVNWDLSDRVDARMTKKLIRQIVVSLSQRVATNSTASLPLSFENTKIVN